MIDLSKTSNLKKLNINLSHIGWICYSYTPQYLYYCKGSQILILNLNAKVIRSIQFNNDKQHYRLDYFDINSIEELICNV